jgi:thiamine pyrophosphokinase
MQPPTRVAQAIVLADGVVGTRAAIDAAWPGWAAQTTYVIAADGGARHAPTLGLTIDRWVGDGDSLGEAGIEALVAHGVRVDRAPVDKDESDTELAVRAALEVRPMSLAILGALGGPRVDHALANLALLALPELRGIDVRLISAESRVRLIGPGSVELDGHVDDLVTLLPVGADAVAVTTAGLAYPLKGETLYLGRSRGLSNRRTAVPAVVRLTAGGLLVVETPATL